MGTDKDEVSYTCLQIGGKLSATVLKVTSKGVLVAVGSNLKGFIPLMYVHDSTSQGVRHKPRDVISTRVLHVIPQKRQLLLTSRPSLVYMEEPIVSELSRSLEGTVTKGVLVDQDALSVKLFGNAKGELLRDSLSEAMLKKLQEGQILPVKISKYDECSKKYVFRWHSEDKQVSSPKKSFLLSSNAKIGKIGSVHVGRVIDKTDSCVLVRVSPSERTVMLPSDHMSDFATLSRLMHRDVRIGMQLTGLFLVNHGMEATDNLPLVTLKETWKKLEKKILKCPLQSVEPGLVVPAMVSAIQEKILHLESPVAAITGIKVFLKESVGESRFKMGASVYVKVKKCKGSQVVGTVSFSKTDRENFECTRLYVRQVHSAIKLLAESHQQAISKIFPGQKISGSVKSVTSKKMKVNMNTGLCGIVLPINYPETLPSEGSVVEAVVLYVNLEKKLVYLSLSPKVIAHSTIKHRDLIADLIGQKSRVSCKVVHESDVMAVGEMESGGLVAIPAIEQFNKQVPVKHALGTTLFLRVKKFKKVNFLVGTPTSAKAIESDIMDLPSMEFQQDLLGSKKRKTESKVPEDVPEPKRKKSKLFDKELDDTESVVKKTKKESRQNVPSISQESLVEEEPAQDVQMESDDEEQKEQSYLKLEDEFDWNPAANLDSAADAEEEKEEPKKALSKAAKRDQARQEEQDIWEKERKLMAGDTVPLTVADFQRLVLAKPNSALCWIQYMGFYLQAAEIDRARSVARKALSTIGFREEREKLDVWFALLNLEHLYGTEETLESTLKEALQMNEQLPVYKYVCDMYNQHDKREAAEAMYNKMARKYRHEKEVWIKFGEFYMKRGQLEAARNVMQRALQSIDRVHHIDIISKFAQMEFKYGERERGKTLYESLLKSYPKRTDLWSVYTDTLLKQRDITSARHVMSRATSLKLPPKKMRTLFKKYLDIELEHGTDESVEEVKTKAAEYVEGKAMD